MSALKLKNIRKFLDNYTKSIMERPRMHGTIPEIEAQWWVMDHIYCLLDGVPFFANHWGEFLSLKGFGSKSASHVIKEMDLKNPFVKLMGLRAEYERWRKKGISKAKKSGKKEILENYKKISDPKLRKMLLLGSKDAWSHRW